MFLIIIIIIINLYGTIFILSEEDTIHKTLYPYVLITCVNIYILYNIYIITII